MFHCCHCGQAVVWGRQVVKTNGVFHACARGKCKRVVPHIEALPSDNVAPLFQLQLSPTGGLLQAA